MKNRLLSLMMLAGVTAVLAEDHGATLFRPVPEDRRKPLNSNRPTQVNTAYTVDSGVAQFETASVIYTRDHRTADDSRLDSLTLVQTNLRLGVTENFELQALVTPFVTARRKDANGAVTRDSGLGDAVVRGFRNLSGNDGQGLSVAVQPYLKLPSNQSDNGLYGNRKIEGGAEMQLALPLDEKTSLCASPGVAFEWDGHSGRDANPYVPVTVFRALNDSVSVFAEVHLKRFTGYGESAFIAQADFGAVWVAGKNLSLDFAVYSGLNRASPDLVAQTGFALRF